VKTDKIPIASLTPEELTEALKLAPSFRGKQIFRWLWRGVLDFEKMTNLPLTEREELAGKAGLTTLITETHIDEDSTVKLKIRLADGLFIETVLLVDERGRKTACLSVQVGCGMRCAFCRTGLMGLKRNLKDYEIAEQLLHLLSLYGRIDNIVLMGMGEPLENLDAVRGAVGIFHHPEGLGMSLRRITISTCGIVSGIEELAGRGPHVRLALSLVTADPSLREKLMPVTRQNPLDRVKDALISYQRKTGRRITLEIVLLAGVNDRPRDAEYLVSFARGLKVVVNLIPWNPASDLDFSSPSGEEVARFKRMLEEAGFNVTERYRRGRGINGACGQLMVIQPDLRNLRLEARHESF